MRLCLATSFALSMFFAAVAIAPARADEACRAALQARIEKCATSCIERAKAAVDPEIRGRILGYGCTNNCAKLEMFNGNTCPR